MPFRAAVRGAPGAGVCLVAMLAGLLGGCPAAGDGGFAPPASRPGHADPIQGIAEEPMPAQCLDEAPTWDRVDALLRRSCRNCHSHDLVGIDRSGAPEGMNFQTEAQVRRFATLIQRRAVVEGSMPPSGALPGCSRMLLSDYLASVADAACEPDCNDRSCGDDGCGGTCGSCEAGSSCTSIGVCAKGMCTPSCIGATCGDDGCGGSCGQCPSGKVCGKDRSCECVPQCDGRSCGSDGCGGTCGTCGAGTRCDDTSGTCQCMPSCSGKQCGDDGCGGSCGTCGAGKACNAEQQCACVPQCNGKSCGPDGCGGSCGTCAGMLTCNMQQGACVSVCTPNCDGRTCGTDGCGGSCGMCGSGLSCGTDGTCACVPDCAGKQCGSDGCGGECGTCGAGLDCSAEGACECVPQCDGRSCGSDGCGGECGTCDSPSTCNGSGVCECTPVCTAGSCGSDGCGGVCGCEQGQTCSSELCTWPTVSFANDVFPLFSVCGGACHAGSMPRASLDLEGVATAYQALVGVASTQCPDTPKTLVVASDVGSSYLINKLTGIGMCDPTTQRQMPRGTGAVPLTEEQLNVIRAWIATGAQNN